MRVVVNSVYPTGIDPLIFYQDVDIEKAPLLQQYYTLLNNNNFDGGKAYLQSIDVDYYGAWLLNTIENRLLTIEQHIREIIGEKPEIVVYSTTEPKAKMTAECFNWTGDISAS